MTIKIAFHRFLTPWRTLHVFVLCALLGATWSSAQHIKPTAVEDAINRVKQDKFSLADVGVIAEAHAVQAIPILKEQFVQKHDAQAKGALASALVTLGDKEEVYWDFLAQQATEAIENDIPFPREFDSEGKIVKDHFSPAFLQWAKDHGISPGDAGQIVGYELPGKLMLLATAGDPRGVHLLQRALMSRNYILAVIASKGLAKLQDKDSIPMIVEAAQKAPSAMSVGIANALLYFDDPDAQNAAAMLIPDRDYRETIRKEIREGKSTPF
jgi:hypothetical protein